MIRKWLERRDQRRRYEAELSGYGWAWAAYMIEGMTLEEIESQCDLGRHFNQSQAEDHFDLGAQDALTDIAFFARAKEAACAPC